MNFTTGQELLVLCGEKQIPVSEAMKRREQDVIGRQDAAEEMARRWEIMKAAAREAIKTKQQTMGGLIGGEAARLTEQRLSGKSICGSLLSKALAYAMGVLEVNASMGLIVAAPTAGSSGVIPGLFLAVQEQWGLPDEVMADALFHAGAIGYLIARNATVAGAEGGCQAEVGTACAMAAGAVTELRGGTPGDCLAAAATALTNILGLVCDPIAGLVEAPCQKRNAMGVANALISAEMSLSGVRNLIPFDEAVEAMYKVGRSLPEELRETALGGVAATRSGCQLCRG